MFCYGSAPGFVDQLIGQPGIELGGRKFEYIGAPAPDTQLLIRRKRTGIKGVDSISDPKIGAELKKAKLDLNPPDGATLETTLKSYSHWIKR